MVVASNMQSWWSWILFVNGVFGLLIYIHKPKIGATYNVIAQLIWMTYGIVTRQYGFVASSVTYMTIWIIAIYKTFKKEKATTTNVNEP